MKSKVLIVGAGYVGISYLCLISDKCKTYIDEIDQKKVQLLNRYKSPINDKLIAKTLGKNKKNIILYKDEDLNDFDFIILCLPTNYNSVTNYFDLEVLERKIEFINKQNFKNLVILKSTVPVGFTEKMNKN